MPSMTIRQWMACLFLSLHPHHENYINDYKYLEMRKSNMYSHSILTSKHKHTEEREE